MKKNSKTVLMETQPFSPQKRILVSYVTRTSKSVNRRTMKNGCTVVRRSLTKHFVTIYSTNIGIKETSICNEIFL